MNARPGHGIYWFFPDSVQRGAGLTGYYNGIIIDYMTQKVLQVGSSAGITISKDVLKSLGLRVGDRVTVEVDTKRGGVVVLPLRRGKNEKEFSAWTEEFLTQYGPALKALAKK